MVNDRGRVTCTIGQLVALPHTWRQVPVDYILPSLRCTDPLAALRIVRKGI